MNSLPSANMRKLEKKSLENMMQECSNRITKEKLQAFSKSQQNSNSTNAWKSGSHPSASKPLRFPSWCCKEIVPPLYHHIEAYVTEEGHHGISNALLLPVLMSSGLQREVLAHIWEMTNQETPGALSPEELYATLAIVALYQAGYNVQSVEALHYFPAPPLPVIHPPTSHPAPPTAYPPQTSTPPLGHPPVTPSPPAQTAGPSSPIPGMMNYTVSQSAASYHQPVYPQFGYQAAMQPQSDIPQATDDDFADFQSSAPPVVFNSSEIPEISDDFGDFAQAVSFESNPNHALAVNSPNVHQDSTPGLPSNTLSDFPAATESLESHSIALQPCSSATGDRYAAFKLIEEVHTPPEIPLNEPEIEPIPSDDFGDFLCAPADVTPTPIIESLPSSAKINPTQPFTFSVADFESENFKKIVDWGSENVTSSDQKSVSSLESPLYIYETDNLDSISISSFHHSPLRNRKLDVEDDISFDKLSLNQLGEPVSDPATQSVSSQESITDPALEGSDTDSAEKVISSFPLTDRYSFIRNEPRVLLDKVSSEWLRCLEKCQEILLNAKELFLSGKEMDCFGELFETEEIQNFIEDFTEVFCVVRRIYAASLTSGRYTGDVQNKFKDVDTLWEVLSSLIYSHHQLPEKTTLDFTDATLPPTQENQSLTCGVCLLDVNAQCNASNLKEDNTKLIYGGREYHTSCANLWVNNVEFLLPGLQNADLL